jgi:hypothetical protein
VSKPKAEKARAGGPGFVSIRWQHNERLTNCTPTLAHWIGDVGAKVGKCKVLAPLLGAIAIEVQFDAGASQRRFA